MNGFLASGTWWFNDTKFEHYFTPQAHAEVIRDQLTTAADQPRAVHLDPTAEQQAAIVTSESVATEPRIKSVAVVPTAVVRPHVRSFYNAHPRKHRHILTILVMPVKEK